MKVLIFLSFFLAISLASHKFTSDDVEEFLEEWRKEVNQHVEPTLLENSGEVVEYYSNLLKDHLHQEFVDAPLETWHEWEDAFRTRYQKMRPKITEFLQKQYEKFHKIEESVKEKAIEVADQLEAKAVDNLERLANKIGAGLLINAGQVEL